MKNGISKAVITIMLLCSLIWSCPVISYAAGEPVDTRFDAVYYADTYPDLKAAYGYDLNALWNHYVQYGQYEKRSCFKGDVGGTIVVGTNVNAANAQTQLNTVATDEFDRLMLEKVNAYRIANGLNALEFKTEPMAVADVRVTEMPVYFEHTRPNGTKYKTVYTDLGYKIPDCGENIAKMDDTWDFNIDGDMNTYVQFIFDAYVSSPGHRRTILKSKWKYFGSAFLTNYNGCCCQVQEFSAN